MRVESDDLPVAVLFEAARRPEVVAAVQSLYAEADRRIAEHGPVCRHNSASQSPGITPARRRCHTVLGTGCNGECCRFGEFGHRLYVTALEVAYYLAAGDRPPPVSGDACPHAHGGRCHARDRRPLGCRIYYCDPKAQDWQGPLTEEYLARLRCLHEALGVPYFYADWMGVLRAIGEARPEGA